LDTTEVQTEVFEKRNYERLRNEKHARDLGQTALKGYEQRRYDEITSALAEALKPEEVRSVINTYYPLELSDENKIVAKDGEPIEDMLVRALHNDIKKANRDEFYKLFLPSRTRHELDELREQQFMATQGPDYNTLVTFSPYSEEYDTSEEANQKLITAHQKPYWKRAMLRVTHWDGENLHIFTRSIDNASVSFLKEVAKEHFDYKFGADDSTSMLGERIKMSLKDESWKDLAEQTIQTADRLLNKRFGGLWRQGNRINEIKDSQSFVESQTTIINSLLEIDSNLAGEHKDFESYKKAFDQQMYNHIALLETRITAGVNEEIVDIGLASLAAGNVARAEGRSYDMCGYVISPGSEANAAVQTGFESLMRLAGKDVECPFCEKKVVVPTEDLSKGKLYCQNCDLGVDVCTGTKFSKGKSKPATMKFGFVDILTKELADWNRNYYLQQQEKKLKQEGLKRAA
jgi:hypothetical protein